MDWWGEKKAEKREKKEGGRIQLNLMCLDLNIFQTIEANVFIQQLEVELSCVPHPYIHHMHTSCDPKQVFKLIFLTQLTPSYHRNPYSHSTQPFKYWFFFFSLSTLPTFYPFLLHFLLQNNSNSCFLKGELRIFHEVKNMWEVKFSPLLTWKICVLMLWNSDLCERGDFPDFFKLLFCWKFNFISWIALKWKRELWEKRCVFFCETFSLNGDLIWSLREEK